jgi:hypothetical protein
LPPVRVAAVDAAGQRSGGIPQGGCWPYRSAVTGGVLRPHRSSVLVGLTAIFPIGSVARTDSVLGDDTGGLTSRADCSDFGATHTNRLASTGLVGTALARLARSAGRVCFPRNRRGRRLHYWLSINGGFR